MSCTGYNVLLQLFGLIDDLVATVFKFTLSLFVYFFTKKTVYYHVHENSGVMIFKWFIYSLFEI